MLHPPLLPIRGVQTYQSVPCPSRATVHCYLFFFVVEVCSQHARHIDETNRLLKTADDLVDPVVYNGVRCMSYGWSPRGKSAAMLRGPMVSGVVTQLARGTDWGGPYHPRAPIHTTTSPLRSSILNALARGAVSQHRRARGQGGYVRNKQTRLH